MLPSIGCKKLIEVDVPATSTNGSNVFESESTAIAVLTGLYARMSAEYFPGGGLPAVSLFAGLSADELTAATGVANMDFMIYYTNGLTSSNTGGTDFWNKVYPLIYVANSAIEGLSASTSINTNVKEQLIGEAKFMRAFFYFYLVNLYGDVPLVISTDYSQTSLLPRMSADKIYKQMVADLQDARSALSDKYVDITLLKESNERVRPTRWAASALLARVYLYIREYVNAVNEANLIIDNHTLFDTTSLHDVFLKNSKEAIWQLQPVTTGRNTPDAWFFIIPSTGLNGDHPIHLNEALIKDFEAGDNRKVDWIGKVEQSSGEYYYAFKYKSATLNAAVTEYEMILRLSEIYLIRSEAKAYTEDMEGAVEDLNVIRNRAGLPKYVLSSKSALLADILHERRIELFTEWGHRWFDLKRTENIDEIMKEITPEKGGTWEHFKQWYPIPAAEIERSPRLVQNAGY